MQQSVTTTRSQQESRENTQNRYSRNLWNWKEHTQDNASNEKAEIPLLQLVDRAVRNTYIRGGGETSETFRDNTWLHSSEDRHIFQDVQRCCQLNVFILKLENKILTHLHITGWISTSKLILKIWFLFHKILFWLIRWLYRYPKLWKT
jgi:hypothetical protein